MGIFDKLRKAAEDLDLQDKAEDVQEAAVKAAQEAMEKVAEFAEHNRDRVSGALEKATHAIDEKTDGRYHDTVSKAAGAVTKGVDKLAGQGAGHKPAAPDVDAPGAPESDAPESDAPESDAPESDAPESDTPESDTPESDAPELKDPETGEWKPPSDIPPADPV